MMRMKKLNRLLLVHISDDQKRELDEVAIEIIRRPCSVFTRRRQRAFHRAGGHRYFRTFIGPNLSDQRSAVIAP